MQVMIDTDHDIKIIHMKYFSSVRRTEDRGISKQYIQDY